MTEIKKHIKVVLEVELHKENIQEQLNDGVKPHDIERDILLRKTASRFVRDYDISSIEAITKE